MGASPNVLLVVLDSVRARNFSLYGHDRETTPEIEQLAERATVYEQARAPGLGSLQSHASMFTGLHVDQHGLVSEEHRLKPGVTIFDDLGAEGYDTGVFSLNTYLTQVPVGLSAAFQDVVSGVDDRLPFEEGLDPRTIERESVARYPSFLWASIAHDHVLRSLWNGASEALPRSLVSRFPPRLQPDELTADYYVDRFLEWSSDRDAPWAACVNLMDAHMPVLPEPEHNRWADDSTAAKMRNLDDAVWPYHAGDRPLEELSEFEALYDGCIHQADAALGRLCRSLADRGELDETLVVVTGDHGEGYGELDTVRGIPSVGHGPAGGLVEEVLHVPLVVRFPGQDRDVTVEDPASLTHFPDVVRSVVDEEWSHDGFVPNGPVVASTTGLPALIAERASRYVDDLAPFERDGRVVYRRDGSGIVRKYVEWGDEVAAFRCQDAQTTEQLDLAPSEVREELVEFDQCDVLATTDEELSDDVLRRLEDLGYA